MIHYVILACRIFERIGSGLKAAGKDTRLILCVSSHHRAAGQQHCSSGPVAVSLWSLRLDRFDFYNEPEPKKNSGACSMGETTVGCRRESTCTCCVRVLSMLTQTRVPQEQSVQL